MNVILNFFVNNYIWFLIISLILIFALIGYFVDTKPDERFLQKVELDKELEARLALAEASNMTLNQMVNNPPANIKNAIVEDLDDETLENDSAVEKLEIEKDSSK